MKFEKLRNSEVGSGGGSVGSGVASDTRDPQSESQHRQNFIYLLYIRKDDNKEIECGNDPSLKRKEKKEKVRLNMRDSTKT